MEFKIPEDKQDEVNKWRREHRCEYKDPMKQGAIGGRITYCFTPTGLGEICKVQCACGCSIDITEYESW